MSSSGPASGDPWSLYDGLLDLAQGASWRVLEVVIGLTWTLCRCGGPNGEEGIGLAMSPGIPTRTLPWSGTLRGRTVADLAPWLRSWDPYESTVAMAAVNACLPGSSDLAGCALPLFPEGPANLAVFQHFAERLDGRRVVVVGRYPGLDSLRIGWDLNVLERQPGPADLPDPAAEYLIPQADWVFLTASTIPNKTFPRLAELARDTRLVLMGPTAPWIEGLQAWGVDYLAGVQVTDPDALVRTVAEGGGTRIFETGVRYAVLDLGASQLDRLRQAIAHTMVTRDALKADMEAWYAGPSSGRYPGRARLAAVDQALSSLDTRFKRAYDAATSRAEVEQHSYP